MMRAPGHKGSSHSSAKEHFRMGHRTRIRPLVASIALASAMAWTMPAAPAASATPGNRLCTWGGTPAAPTGTFSISPGLTNVPSPGPSVFKVTGKLAGDPGCSGTFVYTGQIDGGGTCTENTFEGRANGIRGVTRFVGVGATVLGPARLYDKDGNLVGSENAQVATPDNASHLLDCGTPRGFTGGTFSSVIVLFGSP